MNQKKTELYNPCFWLFQTAHGIVGFHDRTNGFWVVIRLLKKLKTTVIY